MKHRRIVGSRIGGPEVLEFVEADCPEPKAGEVRVRIEAAGVSAYDLMIRSSRLMPPRPPYTPGARSVPVCADTDAADSNAHRTR